MIISASTNNITVSPPGQRPDRTTVAGLGRLPASLIADAQGRTGCLRAAVRLMTPGLAMSGTALPVSTAAGDNLAIHRAVDELHEGDVLVVAAQGHADRAVFGDVLGEALLARGARGIVVDGAVRDVESLLRLGLPTFAIASSPAGPYKNGPGSVGCPVACGGVVCHLGDVVVGDADGVVIVPAATASDVLRAAARLEESEQDMRAWARALEPRLPSPPH